uniref:G-protein coupled receptors family 2 profile 2 domain-containing protein n=1 Tax=Strigamia maritima TaxID=126957 RepID=T1JEI0_STRMM
MKFVLFAILLHLQLSNSSPLLTDTSVPSMPTLPSCEPHENYLPSNNTCVSNTTAKSRPFCKNVLRYFLKWPATIFKKIVCIPFTGQFMRCKRWVYSKDDFYDNTTSIYIKSQKRTYEIDEFDLRGTKQNQEAIVCASETSTLEIPTQDITIYIYSTAWIISIVSLTIAFVLCIAVPAVTTYRAMMPCYIASLLASYIILVIRGLGLAFSSPFACYAVGVALQFSFLSTFFWLNVISFDFYRKVTKPVLNPGRLRLIAYMLYAWGCPLRYAFELVIIMGLFWITEVLSWAVGGDIRYWYATDIVNALQGFFTLIVIARRPKIRSWLRNKCCGCKKDVEEECAFSYVEF